MNFIQEFFNAALAGRHIGKGIRLTRRGKYEEALNHYKLALVYEGKSGAAPNPALREYLARTYTRLGKLKEALAAAEEAYDLYKRLNSKDKLVVESLMHVGRLIACLKSGSVDDAKKIL